MEKFHELKILIVDDLSENLLALSALLKSKGYSTVTSLSGADALQKLSKDKFGLILLDVQMPELNGFEVAERIKVNPLTENIPIVFLTAEFDNVESKIRAHQLGAVDYLAKPIDTELLLLKIANHLKLFLIQCELKEANENLKVYAKNAESSYANLFYSSPDEIFIITNKGFIEKINRSGKLSMGVYASDLLGKHIGNLPVTYSLSSGANPSDVFESVINNGIKGEITEVRLKTPEGRTMYYEIVGSLFHTQELERFLQINIRDVTKRNETKLRLEESENQYKAIVEDQSELICRWNFKDGITFVNEAVCRYMGIEKESLYGSSWEPYVHPDDLPVMHNCIQSISANNPVGRVEHRIVLPTGEVKWVEFRNHGFFDEKGNLINFQSVGTDITEKKQNEEALRIKEAAIEASVNAMAFGDLTGRFTFVNDAFVNLWGYSRNELLQMHTYELYENQNTAIERLNNFPPSGNFETELVGVKKDGTKLFLRLSVTLVKDAKGNPLCYMGSFVDITEKTKAAESIRLSKKRLDEAQRIAKIGSWELDLINNVLYWSDEIYRIFEIDPSKFGASYDAFLAAIHPDDRAAVNQAYTNSLKTKTPYSISHRILFKDGRIKHVHEQCETIYDEKGDAIFSQGTVQDITESTLVLEKLIDSESFIKGVLDSLTSHIAVVDENGWIIQTNSAWDDFSVNNGEKNLLRTSVGSNYFDVCQKSYDNGDEIAGKVMKGISDVLNKKRGRFQIEYPCHSPDRERWFLLTVTNYLSDIPKVVVRHMDITERRKTEQKIKLDSEILSSITDAVIYSDLDFNVIESNENATDVFGWTKKEMIGKRYPDLLKFKYLNDQDLSKMSIQLIKEGRCKSEILAVTKENNGIYISVNTSLLKNQEGIPVGIVSIHRDVTEKIAHEKAIEISELNYKELFEQSPFGIITLDTFGVIQSVNNKTAELTGYSKYKFIGKHFLRSPLNAQPIGFTSDEIFEKIVNKENNGLTFEAIGRVRDGSIMHCEINARYIQEIEKVSLIIRDITDIKNSEKFNQMLFNITSYANSSTANFEGFGSYIQNQLSSYFDTTNFCISSYNHEFNELEFLYLCDSELKNEHVPLLRRNTNGLTEYVIRNRQRLLLSEKALSEFYVSQSIELFGPKAKSWMGVPLIAGSKSVGAIAVQSYRKSVEFSEEDFELLTKISNLVAPIIEKLKNDRQLWLINSAIESAGDGVFITNARLENNPIVFANSKFSELVGYEFEEIYGKSKDILYGPKSGSVTIKRIKESLQNNTPFNGEVLNYRKDGTTFWSDLTLNPIKDRNGKTTNFIGIQNDITNKKEMERMLIEKNKELELFMYRASHDLRGPLSTAKGLIRFASEECQDENIKNYLDLIEKSNNKLDNILSELMEIVLIREGVMERKPTDIPSLVNEVVDSFPIRKELSNGVSVQKIVDVNGSVIVDGKLLKIVLRNVYNNAIKYSNYSLTNSFVKVEVYLKNDKLFVRVSDNGIGIKQNYLNKVFDMFFRATDSSTGTGLGLYITKNAVEKMNGTITIESEEKKGTNVLIKIPV